MMDYSISFGSVTKNRVRLETLCAPHTLAVTRQHTNSKKRVRAIGCVFGYLHTAWIVDPAWLHGHWPCLIVCDKRSWPQMSFNVFPRELCTWVHGVSEAFQGVFCGPFQATQTFSGKFQGVSISFSVFSGCLNGLRERFRSFQRLLERSKVSGAFYQFWLFYGSKGFHEHSTLVTSMLIVYYVNVVSISQCTRKVKQVSGRS